MDALRSSAAQSLPSALVVGCPAGLMTRVHDATLAVGLVPRLCGVVTLPSAAIRHKPACIVLTTDLYEFDPTSFAAVANDSGAALITVDEAITEGELAAILAIELKKRPPEPNET